MVNMSKIRLTEKFVLKRTRTNDLRNIKKLNCWACQIEDFSLLQNLPNLEIINASVNYATTLSDFANCTKLRELYIRKNEIQSLSEISHLSSLDDLRILWFSDNPCVEGADHAFSAYRLTVIRTLPQLIRLDNIDISEEEREAAIEPDLDESLPYATANLAPLVNGHGGVENSNSNNSTCVSSLENGSGSLVSTVNKSTSTAMLPSARNDRVILAVGLLIQDLDEEGLEQIDILVAARRHQIEASSGELKVAEPEGKEYPPAEDRHTPYDLPSLPGKVEGAYVAYAAIDATPRNATLKPNIPEIASSDVGQGTTSSEYDSRDDTTNVSEIVSVTDLQSDSRTTVASDVVCNDPTSRDSGISTDSIQLDVKSLIMHSIHDDTSTNASNLTG